MKKKDLLPVVIIRERRATTSSLEVARIFTKKHKNILRDIENLDVSSGFSRLNFEPRDYTDERGKVQKMYDINRDGFVFLVMGYRGQAAAAFKESYIQEFNRREAEILRLRTVLASNKQNIEWAETRAAGKPVRRIETDMMKKFVEYSFERGSSNAGRYYGNITRMSNKTVFDIQQRVRNTRDICNTSQLVTLQMVDTVITRALESDMAANIPYKQIYQNVKAKVMQFAELFGKSTIPGTLQIGGN